MPFAGLSKTIYSIFGVLLLSTLWITSLVILSDRPTATQVITEAGARVLNPFLAGQGLGVTQSTYATYQASAKAHPDQPLTLQLLKARVLGREISGHDYDATVQIIYGRVAESFYDGGINSAFDVPPQFKDALANFGMFNPDNLQVVPGGPTVTQLPPFLQPFFVFVGLTPDTFTAAGHQRLLGLLPWFWVATLVLGTLTVLLNRNEQKLAGLAQSVMHSTWPIVGVLLALWVAATFVLKATLAPYVGILGLISRAFLPVYGTALVIGVLGVFFFKWLPALRQRQQASASATPSVGLPVGAMSPQAVPPQAEVLPGALPPVPERMPGQP
ncbi:MAG TPA: hypothetical protein VF807_10690 [Ktedonobacterales bacterium]